MNTNMSGKTAIVAGGSAGMGKASAIALAEEGVNLIISARREQRLNNTVEEIRSRYGVEVTAVVADHATEEGRAKLLAACPGPDILIITISPPPIIWEYDDIEEENWLESVKLGLIGPVELIKAFSKPMKEKGWGRIVNIATVAAKYPLEMRLMSGPARSALANYTSVVSRDLAKYGVILNNVLPGMYATEGMIELALPHKEKIEQKYGKGAADNITPEMVHKMTLDLFDIPTHSLGNPKDLAQFVTLLCSDAAKFTVGQNLVLDGGMARSLF
ncbi:SDR family oxidoreductase [Alteromonas sp. ALT199]|uniref:SDR family oxidoreductase n=1 Tax=unclassified Alteromonas TaxID=2614992 RepID=UPI001BE78FEA|nr:SDR family oxidoreductase [Alteromonas sp. ALT199]MBT3136390.1 SDR family oxidoreductase [Alteromonas sp. ALT199]